MAVAVWRRAEEHPAATSPALRATGVRPRKFYATRHTFLSVGLSRGCNAKWVATYCGTSLEMLDRHYGRWMNDDAAQLTLLAGVSEAEANRRVRAAGGRRTGTFPEPSRRRAASAQTIKRRGRFEGRNVADNRGRAGRVSLHTCAVSAATCGRRGARAAATDGRLRPAGQSKSSPRPGHADFPQDGGRRGPKLRQLGVVVAHPLAVVAIEHLKARTAVLRDRLRLARGRARSRARGRRRRRVRLDERVHVVLDLGRQVEVGASPGVVQGVANLRDPFKAKGSTPRWCAELRFPSSSSRRSSGRGPKGCA
jgi:hypothetical protein